MMFVFINNTFIKKEDAKISIFDRSVLFGDSVYEVFLFYKNTIIEKEEHIKRLLKSLQRSYIFNSKFSFEYFLNILNELILKNPNQTEGMIYLQISRGIQHNRYENQLLEPTIISYIENYPVSEIHKKTNDIKKISCKLVSECRRYARDIKETGLLPTIIAKEEAALDGFDDVIFYDRVDGHITESSASNVFIIDKDDHILTCPISQEILAGTVRNRLIEILSKAGFKIEEKYFYKEDIYNAKGIFITGSIKIINEVIKIDDIVKKENQIIKKIKEIYWQYIENSCS